MSIGERGGRSILSTLLTDKSLLAIGYKPVDFLKRAYTAPTYLVPIYDMVGCNKLSRYYPRICRHSDTVVDPYCCHPYYPKRIVLSAIPRPTD